MWEHYQAEHAKGRTPTGAELDRVTWTNNYGHSVLARWRRAGRIPATVEQRPDITWTVLRSPQPTVTSSRSPSRAEPDGRGRDMTNPRRIFDGLTRCRQTGWPVWCATATTCEYASRMSR